MFIPNESIVEFNIGDRLLLIKKVKTSRGKFKPEHYFNVINKSIKWVGADKIVTYDLQDDDGHFVWNVGDIYFSRYPVSVSSFVLANS